MNDDTTASAPPAGDAPPADPPATDPPPPRAHRPLIRTAGERQIAGVSGGVARWLDIDPLVVRVVTVMLAIFGGIGVLAYGIAWVVLPSDDEPESPVQRVAHGRADKNAVLAIGVTLVGIGILGRIGPFGPIESDTSVAWLVLLTVLAVGCVVAVRQGLVSGPDWLGTARMPQRPRTAPTPRDAFGRSAGTAYSPSGSAYAASGGAHPNAGTAYATPAPPAPPLAPAATQPPTPGPGYPGTGYPPEGMPYGPPPPAAGPVPPYLPFRPAYGPPLPPPPVPPAVPVAKQPRAPKPPKPPKPRRERSALPGLTISLALITAGAVVAAYRLSDETPDVPVVLAAVLAVLALGLLVGAFIGRPRGIVALSLLASIALLVSAAIGDNLQGGAGDRYWTPRTAAEAQDPPRLGIGNYRVDLTELPANVPVDAKLECGACSMVIWMPRDANLVLDADLTLGSLTIDGDPYGNGWQIHREVTVPPPLPGDTTGSRTIKISADISVGDLEVRYASS